MSGFWRKSLLVLMVVALIVAAGVGCGKSEEDKTGSTINIGLLMDITGPQAPSFGPIVDGYLDAIKWTNDQKLIPGVTLNGIIFNTNGESAKVVTGYDWLRGQGADVIFDVSNADAAALKDFAARDKIPVFTGGMTDALMNPPGWVFGTNADPWNVYTMANYVASQWDYSKGKPKLAYCGPAWSEKTIANPWQEFAEKTGKFEWVAKIVVPYNVVNYSTYVEQLKDCDFVASNSINEVYFTRDYKAAGYTKMKIVDAMGGTTGYMGLLKDTVGWPYMDGFQICVGCVLYPEENWITDEVMGMLHAYRTEAEIEKYTLWNLTYMSPYTSNWLPLRSVIAAAVKAVGAENVDGQAIYDAAIGYEADWKDMPQAFGSFDESKRAFPNYVRVDKFDGQNGVWVPGDWIEVLHEVPA